MEESAHTLLLRLFRDMPDPRMVGKVSHPLHDILVITDFPASLETLVRVEGRAYCVRFSAGERLCFVITRDLPQAEEL